MPVDATTTPAETPGTVVPLADVKSHLNMPAADLTHDAELQGFVNTAVQVVEGVVGPLSVKTLVYADDRYKGGPIVLPVIPVVSVISVMVAFWPTDVPQDWTYATVLNPRTGVVRFYQGFWYPVGTLAVTYTAGRASLPAPVREAILETVRLHYEQTQQGYRSGYGDEPSDQTRAPIGFYLPRGVLERLGPYRQIEGFA